MKRPLIIAHRGASAEAPENTLAAFRRAIEIGADGVEFDVRLAADGVPVVIHDATLERTAGLKHRIAEMTTDELAQIDVGSWFNRRFPHFADEAYSSETVPTLAKTLEFLSNLVGPIYLEVKIDSAAEVAPLTNAVGRVIAGSRLLPNIIVQSFDLRVLTRIRTHLPDIQTAALFGPRLVHFVSGRQRLVDLALQHGAKHLSLHHSLVNKRIAVRAAAAGLPITVWTVNDPHWLPRSTELEVYAVITNNPQGMQ